MKGHTTYGTMQYRNQTIRSHMVLCPEMGMVTHGHENQEGEIVFLPLTITSKASFAGLFSISSQF